MTADALGDRMKAYEDVTRTRLVRRMPVLMRLDGKAFHTFTAGMPKPYFRDFHECMWEAAKKLCEEIQGVQVAYVQSDEISLLLTDYQSLKSEAWYDSQVQKMVSVAAAICSVTFNVAWCNRYMRYVVQGDDLATCSPSSWGEVFDARVWNLPKEEVVNYFVWRQQDATRNAINAAGQAKFSHRQLQGKNTSQVQEMLFQEHGINFNDYPVPQRRGACVVREKYMVGVPCPDRTNECEVLHQAERSRWVVDEDIPIFTQDRAYIQKFVDAPQE